LGENGKNVKISHSITQNILSKKITKVEMSNFDSSFTQFFFSNVILTTITRYTDFICFCIVFFALKAAQKPRTLFHYFGCFLDHATLALLRRL